MSIVIKDYKILCNKGSAPYNEDIAGVTPYGAWVLDGATGLNNKNLVSKESDAKWYVTWWNEYLHENINENKSLKLIVSEGVDKIKDEYFGQVGDLKVESIDMPSCSAVIIKFHNDKIEYLLLGDCTFISQKENEQLIIKDETVCKFDENVFESISKIKDIKKVSLEDKKLKVMPLIIENRLKKNRREGYWILEFNKEAIDNSVYGCINIDNGIKILLSSDGFSSVFDKYNLYNYREIINICDLYGLDYVYYKIRELENSDKEGLKFPRFKIGDDSSCIYLNIYKKEEGEVN